MILFCALFTSHTTGISIGSVACAEGKPHGIHEWSGCVQDHEEEEDLKAMESRGRTLNRDDFHTEEQYQAYKSSKEAAPKAAFQFGVKVCYPAAYCAC